MNSPMLQVKPLTERLRSIKNPKGCKLLFDVVLYEPPEVKNAVLFATKSVVVCETADDAQYVAYETYHDKIIDVSELQISVVKVSMLHCSIILFTFYGNIILFS